MWANHASSDWLCWAALPRPAPSCARITSGSVILPPNMYRILAAWLTIGSMVERHEVDVHDLGDRAGAGGRRADRRRRDHLLRDRGVADALRAELLDEALGDAEDAAAAPDRHVLAHDEDGRVAPHLLAERLVERLRVGHRPRPRGRGRCDSHQSPPEETGDRCEGDGDWSAPAVLSPVSYHLRVDVRHQVRGVGLGRCLGGRRRRVDLLLDVGLDRLRSRLRSATPVLDQVVAQPLDGVLLAPGVDLFLASGSSAGRRRGARGSGRSWRR